MRQIWSITTQIALLILPVTLGGIATYLEISTPTLTQRELLLVNAIQFVSTIWFGWASSQIVSEEQFRQRQKGFALSAYRRIKEIEYSVDRLITRVSLKSGESQLGPELDVIREMAISLRATARSSKADWADIIGEEIKTLEQIEEIETREEIASRDDEICTRLRSPESPLDSPTVQRLLSSLPPPLEIQARQKLTSDTWVEARDFFKRSLEEKGHIELEGFWDESFEQDVFDLPIGTQLVIRYDDVGRRVGYSLPTLLMENQWA